MAGTVRRQLMFTSAKAKSRPLLQVDPLDGGDDALWIGGPDEGFRIGVGLGDEAVDGELQVNDGLEDAAFEALDGVEPGC